MPVERRVLSTRWDGVWAYVDQNFYKELPEVNLPLDELSFYEKLLFGVLKRNTIYTYVTGFGAALCSTAASLKLTKFYQRTNVRLIICQCCETSITNGAPDSTH